MIRRTAARKSNSDLLQALPWAALLQGVVLIGKRWRSLSRKDRARLVRLARSSQGRVGNLSLKERAELGRLVRKLELRSLPAELAGLGRRGRGRGRCRRARA